MKKCANCKWHEDFSGACMNGLSEWKADFTENSFVCEEWEEREVYNGKSGTDKNSTVI